MKDLISRGKLLDSLPKNDTVLSLDVRRIVVDAPAVDAVPVVHGRWRQDDEDAWTCTACGNMWTFLDGGPNENNAKYCPMCGAKMNGEGDVE